MSKQITLNSGDVAIVDDADYDRVSQHNWYLGGHGKHRYAMRWVPVAERIAKNLPSTEKMHRFILGLNKTNRGIVDHIDHDVLNNTRANLRVTTYSGNNRNRRAIAGGSSEFKGVRKVSGRERWTATIRVESEFVRLGTFATEEVAAEAYDYAAREHFKEFACLNFPNRTIEAPPTPVTKRQTVTKRPNGFRGVSIHDCQRTGRVSFVAHAKGKYLGIYRTPEDAARAYDKAAVELFGHAAYLNFPDETD